ncbi:14625_t:CDS:2, partial [Dentiscutata erythropus]
MRGINPPDDLNEEHFKLFERSCFKDVEPIGEGGSGKVYRAIHRNSEVIVALKSFKNDVAIKEAVKELKLHSRVDMHPNIIRLYGVTKNKGTNGEQTMSRIDPGIQQIQQDPLNLQGSSTNGEQVINRISQDIQQVQQVPLSTNGGQTINISARVNTHTKLRHRHGITTLTSPRKNVVSGK